MRALKRELYATTVFSFVFLIINFVVPAAFINQSSYIEKSLRIISLTYESLGTLMDCETGYRGYMLTKDLSFLEPQTECVCHIQDQLFQLQRLTNDDPDKKSLLSMMKDIASRKVKLSQEIINTVDKDEQTKLVLLSKGKELMDQYRSATAKLISIETETLSSRQLGMHDIGNFVFVARFILSIIMLSFLIHLCWRLRAFKEA